MSSITDGAGFAVSGDGVTSALLDLLMASDIEPGTAPGYELCKKIYSFHPLGSKLSDAPITMAQSQQREISIDIDSPGAELLIEAFEREWENVNRIGATPTIHNAMKTARIYGISALAVGERGVDPAEPLEVEKIGDADIYFNVLDPLNTAGSLVLNQDPNSPDFLKPTYIRVQGKAYHPSRVQIMMNEQPIYIEWSNSAFGFVGRSVYQRALYPLKTYVQSMITDQYVTQKAGLLIAKMKSPGSIISNVMKTAFGAKAGKLKAGVTGQVLTIGENEAIESLNFQNLEGPAKMARENMLKNIATAANMPASMINNETLASGFGEGSEDAKVIARYIDYIRIEMAPLYGFMDRIVQRRAWTPEFFKTLQKLHPEYKDKSYDACFFMWRNKFRAEWPNLLIEPDSEKAKVDDIRMKSVVALLEIALPQMDKENKKSLLTWAQENTNQYENLFSVPWEFDPDAFDDAPDQPEGEGPRMPLAFESET